MTNQKSFKLVIFAAVILACVQTVVLGQKEAKLATESAGASSVKWDIATAHGGGTLTISGPDGRVFSRKVGAGASVEFTLADNQGERLPDGSYTYELRLVPASFPWTKDTLKAARGSDDDSEMERAGRKRLVAPSLVQSGSFSILNGQAIVAGALEEPTRVSKATAERPVSSASITSNIRKLRNHYSLFSLPDVVFADDVIVQGSLCVGLDCVNGEVFGFDTIRTKENNTRIQFDDTSTAAGFPTNNWQIRANDSASGGSSFLGFVDQGSTGNSETGTIVGRFDAGAPANSFKVSSTGKVGLRTATPVLDVHMNTSDTPAIRLEQNNSGGFTAQTWDIAGNEANFFVRDVTSGSRLPFRIRPGAPTSSIDINASGNVGIGTASATSKLTVESTAADTTGETYLRVRNTVSAAGLLLDPNQAGDADWLVIGGFPNVGDFTVREFGVANYLTIKKTTGRVGIGTAAPDQLLSVNGEASKVGGGSWQVFSDERLKTIKGRFNSGLKAVMQLQPLRYEYRRNNALNLKSEGEHVGFAAQTLQKIIPEAVSRSDSGFLMVNNDPIIWTMLNAIKEQQRQIAELKTEVRKLRSASRRSRR